MAEHVSIGLPKSKPSDGTSEGFFYGVTLGVGVTVGLSRLQGDVPRGEKLVDGDEQIPLGVKLIHDLEGGVYALGEDIMHEDDGAVPGLGDHLLDDSGGILIPPVLRIY